METLGSLWDWFWALPWRLALSLWVWGALVAAFLAGVAAQRLYYRWRLSGREQRLVVMLLHGEAALQAAQAKIRRAVRWNG